MIISRGDEAMSLKSVILILLSVLIMGSAGAIEPLVLGSGTIDKAINLDAGAVHQSNSYRMTQSGFVSPAMPQTRVLSTSTMIYQAEKLLKNAESFRDDNYDIYNETKDVADNAKLLRDETRSLYNNTKGMADSAEKSVSKVDSLAKNITGSAEAIEKKASYANKSLDRVQALYNSTLDLSRKIDDLARDSRNNAENTSKSVALMKDYLNESRRVYNDTLKLSNVVQTKYNDTLKLSNAIQNRAPQILDQGMDAQDSSVSVTGVSAA